MLRKYLYASTGILIVLLITVIGLTIYYNNPQKERPVQQENASAQISERVDGENVTVGAGINSKETSFYLIIREGKVCIYQGDEKQFYDYADVNTDEMPIEIREQLKYGLVISSLEELYEFLQTYSS